MANKSSVPRPTATVTAVKGHLVTKSSALAATGSCKLETQFITAQNMASHYKRVINAKSSIDTLPPKSMIKSQKARDRAKRELLALAKSVDRSKSVDSLRISQSITESNSQMDTKMTTTVTPRAVKSARGFKEQEIKPRALPDREKLNRSMSNLMNSFTLGSKQNRVLLYKPPTAPVTTRSITSNPGEENVKSRNALSTLMFNSQNSIDESNLSRLFHPALKATSRLVSNRHYDVLDNHADKFKVPDKEFAPRIKNTSSESNLSKNSNCYQAPRRRRQRQQQQQNASLTSIRNQEESEVKNSETKSINNEEIFDDYEDFETVKNNLPSYKISQSEVGSVADQLIEESNEFQNSFTQSQNESKLRLAAEKEEQLKYLEFIKEVTNDIVSRGISSNRVINNCFEFHIKKNKHELNEPKMRELLATLRKDIGIQDQNESISNENETNESYHQTINKALTLDQQHNSQDDMNTSGNSEYLTLKKFGWTEQQQPKQQMQPQFQAQHTLPKQQSTSKSILTNGTSRNSSRRSSYQNNKENSNPDMKSAFNVENQSILSRKSSESSGETTRKNSNSSSGDSKKSPSILKKPTISREQDADDDDDDDIFASNYEPNKKLAASKPIAETIAASASTSHEPPPKPRTTIVKSEDISEDILFDDDPNVYGGADSEDEDDDFDALMKTKILNKNKVRKRSTESNESHGRHMSDVEEESLNNTSKNSKLTSAVPQPVPRKSTTNNNKKEQKSDEDDDDDEF